MRRPRFTWLSLAVHLAAWLPLLVLVWDAYHDNLTVNPIQAVEQRTGMTALVLLMLSLSVTPLHTLTGLRQVIPLRRPLGNYAFGYALLHFIVFAWLDYGLDWEFLQEAVLEKPYALVGLAALLLLVPLAATSWRWWMKKLGKTWKRLHRLVYLAGILVVVHYGWVKKGDFFRASGDVVQPLLYGLLILLLLGLRIPAVRRKVVQFRIAIQSWLRYREAPRKTQISPRNNTGA